MGAAAVGLVTAGLEFWKSKKVKETRYTLRRKVEAVWPHGQKLKLVCSTGSQCNELGEVF